MIMNLENRDYDKYNVIDLNTGIRIPGVQEANDKTGEISLFLTDFATGEIMDKYNPETETRDMVIFKFIGNIKIIKKEE